MDITLLGLTAELSPYDLQARYFGCLTGLYWGFLGMVLISVCKWLMSLWSWMNTASDISGNVWKKQRKSGDFFNAVSRILFGILRLTLFFAVCVVTGYFSGLWIDLDYYVQSLAVSEGRGLSFAPHHEFLYGRILGGILIIAGLMQIVCLLRVPRFPERMFFIPRDVSFFFMFLSRTFRPVWLVVLGLCSVLVCEYTEKLARPELVWRPVSLPEGIYLYVNDVVSDNPPLDIYSSRMGGFMHSGLCLITREATKINKRREQLGEKELYFHDIGSGLFMNDLNLDITDADGLTNYASRTSLSQQPFPCDEQGLSHYLSGRSSNDRLFPAARLKCLQTEDAEEEWMRVVAFRDWFNRTYPEGFIYSPVPVQEKYVRLYNCNTVISAIISEVMYLGDSGDELTHFPLSLGGQTAEAGREMLRDILSADFKERSRKQLEFFQTAPRREQSWMYFSLYKGGFLHYLIGWVVDKEYSENYTH